MENTLISTNKLKSKDPLPNSSQEKGEERCPLKAGSRLALLIETSTRFGAEKKSAAERGEAFRLATPPHSPAHRPTPTPPTPQASARKPSTHQMTFWRKKRKKDGLLW